MSKVFFSVDAHADQALAILGLIQDHVPSVSVSIATRQQLVEAVDTLPEAEPTQGETVRCCSNCGCIDLEESAWINAYTRTVVVTDAPVEDSYCPECEESVANVCTITWGSSGECSECGGRHKPHRFDNERYQIYDVNNEFTGMAYASALDAETAADRVAGNHVVIKGTGEPAH